MMLVNSGHYKENSTIWFHALPFLLVADYYFVPSLFWPPASVPIYVLLQALASLLPSQHLSVPSVVDVHESLLPDLQVYPEGFVCYGELTCNHGHVTWKIWLMLLLGTFPGKLGLLQRGQLRHLLILPVRWIPTSTVSMMSETEGKRQWKVQFM